MKAIAAILGMKDIRERHPLKQGLKHSTALSFPVSSVIRERHPLKQGLKQNRPAIQTEKIFIRERHPLKQGLKQTAGARCAIPGENSGKTSTKTRIETPPRHLPIGSEFLFGKDIH